MVKYISALVLGLLGPAADVWPQDVPQTLCLHTDLAPVIDGRGDDAVWQNTEPFRLVDISDFSGTEHSRATEVRLLWDQDALYVLFTSFDPDVWSTLDQRDAPLYNEEVIELFIDPDGDGRNYVEIELNSINTLFDVLVSNDPEASASSYPEWDPQLFSAVSVSGSANNPDDTDQSWSAELAVPWSALQTPLLDLVGNQALPPRIGDVWRFNFYRYERLRQEGSETGTIQYSAWSPTGAINFHVPERFGRVVFAAKDGNSITLDDDAGYPPGTLVPSVDLGLQPTSVQVPAQFRDQVPEGLSLNLPPGFSVSVFAVGFSYPRFLAFDDNDVLHLADLRAGEIIALPDRNGDGVADEHIVAAAGFRSPHSLTFYQGGLYVGDPSQIIRLLDADLDQVYEQRQVLVDGIPAQAWHTLSTVVIDASNEKIYVGVGSPCDLCRSSSPVAGGGSNPLPPNPEWGTILEFNTDGTGRRIFATGVRNTVGLTLHPLTNELWGNNNGHDLEGRSKPPEWIDIIRDGDFMGHPFVHSYQVWNDFQIDRYQRMLPITREDSLLAAKQKRPVALVPAHYAPMGLHFYTHDQFPDEYRNAAFVAFRAGKAKLSSHPGYNVSALFSEPDGSNARMGEFITGFQTGTTQQSVWGFPQGLATDQDGSLYISSDAGNRLVLKVTYNLVGGSWQHNLPDSISVGGTLALAATVEVERLVEGGGTAQVTADLSELGGPPALPLAAVDEDTYRLDYDLDLKTLTGLRSVRIRLAQEVEGEIQGFDFVKTIALYPRADAAILEDQLATDWASTSNGGAAPLEWTQSGPGRGGEAIAALSVAPEGGGAWGLVLQPATEFYQLGYESLYFAFHPGTVAGATASVFNLQLNQVAVNLLDQVDLKNKSWQEVEIPLADFALGGPIRQLRLSGDFDGTFYLDDLRFKLEPHRSPIRAVWQHDLPEAVIGNTQLVVAATVRLTRFAPGSPPPLLTADLSELGGPTGVPLRLEEDNTYSLNAQLKLEDVPFGLHHLWVRVEQVTDAGRHWQRLAHGIVVLPPDMSIFDEDLAEGWGFFGTGGAQVLDALGDGPVFNGRSAAAVQGEPKNFFTPWAIEWTPPAPIERGEWAGVRFVFHPGGVQLPNLANMVLVIDGLRADLLRGPAEFRLDLERPEWQVVEVPFTTFDVLEKYGAPNLLDSVKTIASIRLEGNMTGTFYLDDVRLVSGIPAAPPPAPITAIIESRDETLPTDFALEQNYPNPFNSETLIRYALPQRATVVLEVHNLAGQEVARLVYGLRAAGVHTVKWDGRNNADKPLASGMYIYRLRAGGQILSRKLMLIR